MDNEDFGLARSFTKSSVCAIAPQFDHDKKQTVDVEDELCYNLENELKSDGFCFKLAPGENVIFNIYKVNQLFFNYSNKLL